MIKLNNHRILIKYWDVNNLYEQAMSLELPVDDFKWVKQDFLENYNEDSDEEYFLEFDVQYPENLLNFHNDLSFLTERMKIENVENLAANLHNKKNMLNT